MPRIVDKDARREEIIATYTALVLRDGLQKVSTRVLAKELGIAVGGLWGYFDSVQKLRLAAFERSFDFALELLDDSNRLELTGLDGFVRSLEGMLPLRDESSKEAQIQMAFLEDKVYRTEVYAVQNRMENHWHSTLTRHLSEAQQIGDLLPHVDPDELAHVTLALAIGLQMEFVAATPRGNPKRIWQLVEYAISPWLSPGVQLPTPRALGDTPRTS